MKTTKRPKLFQGQRLKKAGHSVRKSCYFFEFSTPGFYQWLKRTPSERKKQDQNLKRKISNIFERSKKNYGSPRIHKLLQSEGEKIGKDKVAQLMVVEMDLFNREIKGWDVSRSMEAKNTRKAFLSAVKKTHRFAIEYGERFEN